jgi:hypothetical protein
VGEEIVRLEDDANLRPDLADVGAVVIQPHPVHPDLAGLDGLEVVEAPEQRALAGAARPDDHHDLAPCDIEAHVVEHVETAEVLVDVADLKH